MILEFSMRGIQNLDHLNGCNKRIHRNRRHPTLNTPTAKSGPLRVLGVPLSRRLSLSVFLYFAK